MRLSPALSILAASAALSVFSPVVRPLRAQTTGGLTRLYPWPEEAPNLIANPSFELALSDVPRDWNLVGSDAWLLSPLQKRTGFRSLQLRNSHLSRVTPLATETLQLAPGWYSLRGYLKAERAGSNTAGAGGRIALWVEEHREATPVLSGTTGWTLLDRSHFLVKLGGQAQVRLEAYRKPDGSVFFDDVALHRLRPPFVEGFLLYPNYRGLLFQDLSQAIRVSVTAHPGSLGRRDGDYLVRLVLQNAAGAVVSSVQKSVRSGVPTTFVLDATRAPLGRSTLRLLAIDAATRVAFFEYPPYAIVKTPASARSALETYVDGSDRLLIQGRRRFALGIYDSSGKSSDPAYYEPRIRKIAEAPFNLYLNPSLEAASRSELSALTATLRKYGMSYLHSSNGWYPTNDAWDSSLQCGGSAASDLGPGPYTTCKARELRDVPGLAGWHTGYEEPADRASAVFNQYLLLRSNDPDGVAFLAQDRPKELSRWRDAADVLGVDPYPIVNVPLGSLSPLEQVIDWVGAAEKAVHHSRPVWAVLQFFSSGPNGHWPTASELRTMTYMAVIGGAQGVLYRSFGAGGLGSVRDPELREQYWQRLLKLTREIRALEPVLLAPTQHGILVSVSDARIRTMSKRVGDVRYVFAVNRADTTVRASFRLSQPGSRAEVRGEGRSLPVSASVFADTFLPYAVHIYQVPLASGSTTTTSARTTTTTVPPTTTSTTTSVRTTTTTASAGTADLSLRLTGPATGLAGQSVAYTITVANFGPASVRGVLFQGSWSGSSPAMFLSIDDPRCAPMSATQIGCNLGAFGTGASHRVTLRLRPARAGTLAIVGSVVYPSPPTDPNRANNSSSVSTSIR